MLTSVMPLFETSGPPAIPRLVVPLIIDAIEGEFFRGAFTHVPEECWETSAPTFADENSSTSPVLPLGVFSIAASAFHRLPRVVSQCPRAGRALSMFRPCLFDKAQAAAAALAGTKASAFHDEHRPASASTLPYGTGSRVDDLVRDCQDSKRHSSQVDLSGHYESVRHRPGKANEAFR